MGLAGRKQKQRIPADPRNLTWADDASRFGHAYLSKFGWDASQGLGSSGEGIKTHLKVQQKLDMMGIGAQHQRDPNGIAWKQNKEFEALLKRLNESALQGEEVDSEAAEGETEISKGFVRAHKEETKPSVTTEDRKRKHRDDATTPETTRKKQRKEKEERKKSSSDDSAAPTPVRTSEPPPARSPEPTPKPRPMAHRARIRAAKRIADKSPSAIAEILGIAPSPSTTPSASTPTPAAPTPATTSTSTVVAVSFDNLTASTKSIADYFSAKLLARSASTSFPAPPSTSSVAPSGSATPGLGAGPRLSNMPPPVDDNDDDGEPPRRGIGSQVPAASTNDEDAPTEKQRRKADRRRRRKTEASRGASADVEEQRERDEVASKKHKKRKKRAERGERGVQTADGQPNYLDKSDDDTEKGARRARDGVASSTPEPSRKPKKEKKEHGKKRL